MVETFPSPTIATKSAQVASKFGFEVSCFGGVVEASGRVEAVEGGVGFKVPK